MTIVKRKVEPIEEVFTGEHTDFGVISVPNGDYLSLGVGTVQVKLSKTDAYKLVARLMTAAESLK